MFIIEMAEFYLSTFAGKSNVVEYYCCTICEIERSVEVDADFYCKKCMKFFCRTCILSHRQHGWWFNKQYPYGKDEIMKWPLSKKMESCLRTCDIHKDRKLTMLCYDHKHMGCSRCVALYHRLCLQVSPLFKAAQERSIEFKKISDMTQNTLSRMKLFQTCQENRMESLKVSYNEYEKYMVKCMRQNITSFLLKCDNCTINENNEYMQYTADKMREKITSFLVNFEISTVKDKKTEMTVKLSDLMSVRQICTMLHDELLLLYVALQKVQNRPELYFIASEKCAEKIQAYEYYYKKSFSNQVFTVTGMSVFNLQLPSDSNTCRITAICDLDGQVLVADNNNYKIMLLNQQYQVLSQCDVAVGTLDMCQTTPSEVVVAVDDNGSNTHEVQFFTVHQNRVIPGRKFQLQHSCRGIAHNQGDLFITSSDALYNYSVSGRLVCMLYHYKNVDKCAVSPTGDKLYITSYLDSKLLTLARNGTLLATCEGLFWPRGVHVTPAGHVLICEWGSHTILQVKSDGMQQLATLATREMDGLWYPCSICYSSTTSSIIVGQYDRDIILVYKVE